MNPIRHISALLILITASFRLNAGPFRYFDERNGLPESCVLDVMQDSTGYIWILSPNSVSRFDGKQFRNFGAPVGEYSSFKSFLAGADCQTVWIASYPSLYRLDTRSGEFASIAKDVMKVPLRLLYDTDGRMWVAAENGVFILEGENAVQILDSHSQTLTLDADGNVWAASGSSLLCCRRGCKEFKKCADSRDLDKRSSGDVITSVAFLPDQRLWVGTWSGKVGWLDSSSVPHLVPLSHSIWPKGMKESRIHDIFNLSSTSLMLATDSGLIEVGKFTGKSSVWDERSKGNSYYKVVEDRNGGIWIGTYFNGLVYASPISRRIRSYSNDSSSGNLAGDAVSCFAEDESGRVWIGTENGGLSCYDRRSSRTVDFSRYSYNNLHALLVDGGYLYIGTFSKGLQRLNLSDFSVESYLKEDSGLPDNHVYSLTKLQDGRIAVGTIGGLSYYDPRTSSVSSDGNPGRFFCIDSRQDSYGNLWVATANDGLWRLDKDSGQWTSVGLPTSHLAGLCNLSDGTMAVATENAGVFLLNPSDGTVAGLPFPLDGRRCTAILEDSNHILWVTSNKGILKLDTGTGSSVQYTYESGFQSNRYLPGAAMKDKNGIFWVGGVNGFDCFNPLDMPQLPTPRAVISGLDSDGESKGPTSRIELPYRTRSLTVHYSAIEFQSPDAVTFSWRLAGYESRWHETDEREVTFLSIPSGQYRFEVKATVDGLEWSPQTASVDLLVSRNPWTSWWMIILYAVTFFVGLFMILKSVLLRQKEKQTILRERKAVEDKMSFIGAIAHEIKTPLTLIKAPLESVLEMEDLSGSVRAQLSVVGKNTERLHNLILQLLDFRKIEREAFELNCEDVDIVLLLKEIRSRFVHPDGNVRIDISLPEGPLVCRTDPEALTKIVSNLLMNAIKYGNGHIELKSELGDGCLWIFVRDDGPGLPEDKLDEVFKPFYRINPETGNGFGIGLSLVRLLAGQLGGEVTLSNAPGGGCVAIFSMPFHAPESSANPQQVSSAAKGTMLIVDDNAEIRDLLQSIFEQSFCICKAANGREALEVLGGHPEIEFIISDLMMPEMGGFELLKAVRSDETVSGIPFIILSARNETSAKVSGLQSGADAYIEKPFSPQLLRSAVESILANRRRAMDTFKKNPDYHLDTPSGNEFLERIDAIISEHIDDPRFGMEELAEQTSMSRSSLQRKFKTLIGETPGEYIKACRLRAAAKMIREGRLSIGEIAFHTGFSDQSYFTKCFSAQFGCLPKDYRA